MADSGSVVDDFHNFSEVIRHAAAAAAAVAVMMLMMMNTMTTFIAATRHVHGALESTVAPHSE